MMTIQVDLTQLLVTWAIYVFLSAVFVYLVISIMKSFAPDLSQTSVFYLFIAFVIVLSETVLTAVHRTLVVLLKYLISKLRDKQKPAGVPRARSPGLYVNDIGEIEHVRAPRHEPVAKLSIKDAVLRAGAPGRIVDKPRPGPEPIREPVAEPIIRSVPRPAVCGKCHEWQPISGFEGRIDSKEKRGLCTAHKFIRESDSTDCPDHSDRLKQEPVEVLSLRRPRPPAPETPVKAPEPVQEPREVPSPAESMPLTEEELQARLEALDKLRLIADDEEFGLEDEKKKYAMMKQRGQVPRGYISKIMNTDLFDKKGLWDSSLTRRENEQNVRESWRGETYTY
jgi:hypothetical protein